MLVVNSKICIPLAEFEFTFSRSPGPGGQNVNKVNSKAQLKWDLTLTQSLPPEVMARFKSRFANRLNREGSLVLASHRFRDQSKNVDDCLSKLKEMVLQVATAPRARKATRPTQGSVRRRLGNKKLQSQKKQSRRGSAADD